MARRCQLWPCCRLYSAEECVRTDSLSSGGDTYEAPATIGVQQFCLESSAGGEQTHVVDDSLIPSSAGISFAEVNIVKRCFNYGSRIPPQPPDSIQRSALHPSLLVSAGTTRGSSLVGLSIWYWQSAFPSLPVSHVPIVCADMVLRATITLHRISQIVQISSSDRQKITNTQANMAEESNQRY